MITIEMLKSWSPCESVFKRFCELFPDGIDLLGAIDGLVADGHDDWGKWLFDVCKRNDVFGDVTVKGYRNSGDGNSGDRNSGYWNSGYWNSGDENSGDGNSGDRNSGYWNSGDGNSGDENSGDGNSGDRNSGYWNSGDRNSGYWNSGDWNSGFFNTKTPEKILVFGKMVSREVWDDCHKPDFLYFNLTYWVSELDMTDEEKANDPNFYVRGGQLRRKEYKEAFIESWENANKEDREKVRELPGFDAEMFYEISGIDLR